ncbi:hypothetical protein GF314_02465 [bacterium]|nr:hypothetical protein [bacterium]
MKPSRLLLAVFLIGGLVGASRATWPPVDKSTPAATWPGRIPSPDDRGFDVEHYDLDLALTSLPPNTGRIAARARLRLSLLTPPPDALRLDLVDELTIDQVWRDGDPVPFVHQGDSLMVPLEAPMVGAVHEITIDYAGRPPRHGPFQAGLLMRRHGPDNDEPTIGNVSQPYSTHSWLPCKDHPADKSTLAMRVTAPDTLTVVATGRLLEVTPAGPGEQTWHWRTDHQVAPYLIGLVVSNFVSWFEDCDGTPLEYHVFAEHQEDLAGDFAPTCAMLRWLEDLVGPYPFPGEKYAQAEFVWLGAMENQTVSTMGTTAMLNDGAELVVVHELAHHWFGNNVTPRRWADIWLNEGFARYVECLWLERAEGRDQYLEYLDLLRRDDLFVGDGLLGDPDPVLSLLVYDKGAWVLHMLREYLGDDVFFAALAEYAGHPELQQGHIDRAAFEAIWSQATGRDVAAFLAPWLDTEAVPELSARWRDLGGDRRLVEVLQTADGPSFRLRVPVEVHAGGLVERLDLLLEDRLGRREIATVAPIDSLVIDPEGLLLRRTATTPPPRLIALGARPNPARGMVNLAYRLAAPDVVEAVIHDARGRRVRSVDLGLQPATGDEPAIWVWDGRDEAGRRVASGVYWLELRTPTDRTVRKVTLLR